MDGNGVIYISLGYQGNPDCGSCTDFRATNTEPIGGIGREGTCIIKVEVIVYEAWNPVITLRTNKEYNKARLMEEGKVPSCHSESGRLK